MSILRRLFSAFSGRSSSSTGGTRSRSRGSSGGGLLSAVKRLLR
ncbi:hypothetical protein [Ilumatobacter sp.]